MQKRNEKKESGGGGGKSVSAHDDDVEEKDMEGIYGDVEIVCDWAGVLVSPTDPDSLFVLSELRRFGIGTARHVQYSSVMSPPLAERVVRGTEEEGGGGTPCQEEDIIKSAFKVPTSYVTQNISNGSRTIVHYRQLPEYNHTQFQETVFRSLRGDEGRRNPETEYSDYDWIHFEGRNVPDTLLMLQMIQKKKASKKCSGIASLPYVSLEIEKERNVAFSSSSSNSLPPTATDTSTTAAKRNDGVYQYRVDDLFLPVPSREQGLKTTTREWEDNCGLLLWDVLLFSKPFVVGRGYHSPRQFLLETANRILQALRTPTTSCGIMICTWGSEGAFGLALSHPSTVIHGVARKVRDDSDNGSGEMQIVDTLGAGDTFNAAIIYQLLLLHHRHHSHERKEGEGYHQHHGDDERLILSLNELQSIIDTACEVATKKCTREGL